MSKFGCFIFAVALMSMGCYSNRAVLQPGKYAPANARSDWKPPANLRMRTPDLTIAMPALDVPLSLAEAIDMALQNSPTTRRTWARARAAAASWGQAQAADFPTISGSYSWTRSRELVVGPAAPTSADVTASIIATGIATEVASQTGAQNLPFYLSEWGPQLSLTYTLFDFGQRRATSESARWALYFADWSHNRNIQTLIQIIMSDYYNYIYQVELLHAMEENIRTAQITLDSAEVGLRSGVHDISDVLQAKTQLLQTEILYVAQKQALETSFAELLNEMGLPANLQLAVEKMPKANASLELLPQLDDLISQALEYRPDLLAAEADLKSKQETLRAAKKEYYPNIDYQLDIGQTTFTGNISDGYDFTSTLSLNIPLFAGFFYQNGIRVARANKNESESTVQNTYLNVVKEVTVAHTNVKIAYETLQYTEKFLEAAKEEYRVALSQYRSGTAPILNVISAQSSLADARAKQVNSIQQWFTSLANLAYATGSFSPTEKL